MNRTLVIHTGDEGIGRITSVEQVQSPPAIGNIYQVGPKHFEVVEFTDDGKAYQVYCKPYIEAVGEMQ